MTTTWPQLTANIYHRLAFGCAYGLTDVGLVRQSNQDNFLIDPHERLVAVADGMGGHDGGEVAARLALETLRDTLAAACPQRAAPGAGPGSDADPDATWQDEHMPAIVAVHDAVDAVNARVYDANVHNGQPDGGGMGTTLTGFWQSPALGPLIVFHVGDSRLYRLRAGVFEQLTRDQTMYQAALEAGLFDALPPRNVLLQAVGPSESVVPEVRAHMVLPGDLLMLCSDGLHGALPHTDMESALAAAGADALDVTCAHLIELAYRYGGRDNITVVLAAVQGG